jgi:hypothetical protein
VLGEVDAMPPFQMPQGGESNLPPAIGYPVPVREDGTLPLPLVPPLKVRGLTLTQVENVIRKAYTVDQQILGRGKDRIFVTLMKQRTYTVIVMRQEPSAGLTIGPSTGKGGLPIVATQRQVLELPAYQNDVLHSLVETGGVPGESMKNEVKILKGRLADARRRDAFVQQFYACPPPRIRASASRRCRKIRRSFASRCVCRRGRSPRSDRRTSSWKPAIS